MTNEIIKIDLGCGARVMKGYIRIDIDPKLDVDHTLDINKDRLPFEDSSVDEIHCSHVLEHIQNMKHFFEETYRVLKSDGKLNIIVPHYRSEEAYADPGHVRKIPPRFFEYLSRNCRGSDSRPLVWGKFDFEAISCVNRIKADAKKRFRNEKELEFASTYLANVVGEIDVTIIPIKPARVTDSKIPSTDLNVDWEKDLE